MNEQGIISLTALCMMMILAISIATMKNIAARQADIVRYYKLENELQSVAESHFNEVVANISENADAYGELSTAPSYPKTFARSVLLKNGKTINVTISLRKVTIYKGDSTQKKIFIMSLAELKNYNYGEYSVHRRVIGYMSELQSTISIESDVEDEKYEFTGYIY